MKRKTCSSIRHESLIFTQSRQVLLKGSTTLIVYYSLIYSASSSVSIIMLGSGRAATGTTSAGD